MQLNTFSIAARCPRTGMLGVTVSTAVPAVGSLCPHVRPGVGAVTSNTEHAIDLLSNTQGGITINNSGTIEGDLFFGAAGGNDTLNVGNVTNGTGNTATGELASG